MGAEFKKVVRVHCGSAYVAGKARRYRYVIAQLFVPQARQDGVVTYRSTGIVAGPYRSDAKAEQAARELAVSHGAEYMPGYGSFHGRRA